MSQISVLVASPEEAYDGIAEFWCGAELMGVTILSEGGMQPRIYARADGRPCHESCLCPVFAGAHTAKGST
jgi:hypothetical protein